MKDWDELFEEALTPEELREQIDLELVVREELSTPLWEEGGRMIGHCPFHDDTRPSFAIFGFRVGCWSCDWRGDVFDVIRAARDCTFKQAQQIVQTEYLGRGVIRAARPTEDRDPGELRRAVRAAQRSARFDPSPITAFLEAKGISIPTDWLMHRWRVGASGDRVIAPHYDETDAVTGYKHRTAAEPWKAASGSRFRALYGDWPDSDIDRDRVILCEGETDAWWVDWCFGDEVLVLALPTGAQTMRDSWIARLHPWHVTVALDPDEAGQRAAHKVIVELPRAVIATLPEGQDCASIKDVQRLAELLCTREGER